MKKYVKIIKQQKPATWIALGAILVGIIGLLLSYRNSVPTSLSAVLGRGDLVEDVLPLYTADKIVWGPGKSYTATLGPDVVKGYRASSDTIYDITDLTAIFLPFEQHYSRVLIDKGWRADISLSAGGPGSEQAVYRKGDEYAVIAYTTRFKGNSANEPVRCPCDITLTVFTGSKSTDPRNSSVGDEGDPDSTVIITASDNGKTVTAPVDQYVALELTKQRWTVTTVPTGILVPQNPPAAFANASGYFRAVGAGTVTLKAVSGGTTFTTTVKVER